MDGIINKTGQAVIAIAMIIFCAGMVVLLTRYGSPSNSLHESSLSWAWTGIVIGLGAVLGNISAATIASLLAKK
jgi:hypothetical protein